jgi:7-carboxy-7-deazaguanine synthase
MSLRVLEIYDCFQGEGTRIGEPSTLCRFFGCNLMCLWCDTKYSINPKLHEELGGPPIQDFTVDSLVAELAAHNRSVILTGGEPTLQKELPELLDRLTCRAFVTIETNGTHVIDPYLVSVGFQNQILWSISPKPNQVEEDKIIENLASMVCHWAPISLQVKFVVDSDEQVAQALRIVQKSWTHHAPVVLQPNGDHFADAEGALGYAGEMRGIEWLVQQNPEWRQWSVRVLPQLHAWVHGRQKRLV